MQNNISLKTLPAGLILAFGMVQTVSASGFALIEQSGSAQGTSYAGAAASTEDASVMWFNPAGLTQIQTNQLIVAGHVISPQSEFHNTNGTEVVDAATVGFVPNFYWKTKFADYDFGFGVNVPYGQRLDYGQTWSGRYIATETDLKTINFNPAIARKIHDKLSLGFGLNAQYVDVILAQKFNQSFLGQPDANAEVTGDSWALGYNVGILFQPSERMNIGFAYRSKMSHDVDGKVDYTGVNNTIPLPNLGGATLAQVAYDMPAKASVTLPATATLAMDYALNEKTNLLASSTWTSWTDYDQLVIEFENGQKTESNQEFEHSMRYAVGMIHQYTPSFKVRAGVAIDYTPVPSSENRSPRTPDSTRKWVSVGLGYQISPTMNVDVAYSHLFASNSEINYTQTTSLGSSNITGYYDSAVDIFSAQLVWNY